MEKMDLQFLHGNFSSYTIESILNSNFFVNPFSSDMYRPVITTYIHYSAGADELAITHGKRFSP